MIKKFIIKKNKMDIDTYTVVVRKYQGRNVYFVKYNNGEYKRQLNIKLSVGKKYRFVIDAYNHPFFFTTDKDGGRLSASQKIKGSPAATMVGQYILNVTDDWLKYDKIYYQCQIHQKMGGLVIVK
jgi:hypothetical protein